MDEKIKETRIVLDKIFFDKNPLTTAEFFWLCQMLTKGIGEEETDRFVRKTLGVNDDNTMIRFYCDVCSEQIEPNELTGVYTFTRKRYNITKLAVAPAEVEKVETIMCEACQSKTTAYLEILRNNALKENADNQPRNLEGESVAVGTGQ